MEADRRIIDTNEIDNIDPNFSFSLIDQSMYLMFYHQRNLVDYARNTKKIIRPSLFTDFGFSPSTISVSYLTSRLSSGPMRLDDAMINPNVYGSIDIRPSSFLVRTETEQRSRTIFNALGLLGGAWTGSLTVYAILFGNNILKPWGCIHSYCCCYARKTRLLLRKSFPTIPLKSSKSLISLLSPDSSASTNDLLLQQPALSQHLDSLELFLKEYVVDSTYLEDSNSNDDSNKLSKLLGKLYWRSNSNSKVDAISPQISPSDSSNTV
ncbi:9542_t:CDS:2 [Paraglomus brasilianum]|uniref:9542_t:CDS:1 n=1 Tax=Paraglomus brasilianum TaxID=144538 RepID=A0A9N9GIJ9_9GLOM|nr:9542_t:CDS:2 [Paraglomus brasilianum]